jgi:hypothetical protein
VSFAPIPGGAFDKSAQQQPTKQSRPWALIILCSILALALLGATGFALYQSGRASQAAEALRNLPPPQAAIIPLPTDAPSPAPTTAPTVQPTVQAQPTAQQAAAPTAANTATALPPTAIPDTRPQVKDAVELHKGTPAGDIIANLIDGDRFKPSYWMNVGGVVYLYATTEFGVGWFMADAAPDYDYTPLAELVIVQGVKAEYSDRGPFVTMFEGKAIAWAFNSGEYKLENRVALIGVEGEYLAVTNGDFLRVQKREGTTIFFVTTTNNVDGEVALNMAGALPEWVVTGDSVPPAPTPVPATTGGNGGGNGGGSSCNGTYLAYRYIYTPSAADADVGHSQVNFRIDKPAGFCSYDTSSVTVILGGDGGDGIDLKKVRLPLDVANGMYRFRLVQYTGPQSYSLISEQWIEVKNGHRVTAIFAGGTSPVR